MVVQPAVHKVFGAAAEAQLPISCHHHHSSKHIAAAIVAGTKKKDRFPMKKKTNLEIMRVIAS